MPITIELRNEDCVTIERPADVFLTAGNLPDFDDARYPYLRLIDPYGDTVFSRHQMIVVLPELERLAIERPSAEVESVLVLARRCATSVHTYLAFLGD